MSEAALDCGNCGATMREIALAGHYGRSIAVDICQDCDLVWFDDVETARLTGPGVLELIGEMAAAQRLPHRSLATTIACPRCRGPVRSVHNRSRWGVSMQLACVKRHGAYQSFAQFLSEKGMTRTMSSADRAHLLQRDGSLFCINCGAQLPSTAEQCSWCESTPAVIDIARLANSLDPEGATARHPVHATPTRSAALNCMACGCAVPETASWSCPQCKATLVAAGLAEAYRRIVELGPALRAHAAKPAPEIVRQRLDEQSAAMQRQREWAAEMQADADARSGRLESEVWKTSDIPLGRRIGWLALLIALLVLWHWW